ncbi:MAG TPA: methyltransferase domain-containing protein [Spirochaetia bacterium]|nr:methyltransferase domain-containing protein [Spirochaetia bacterium]
MTFSVLQPEDLEQILSSSGNRYPIEVEIGCGNGHFLTEYGSRNRNHVFIGIDLKKSRCEKSAKKATLLGLHNVHIVCGKAEEILGRLPESSIAAFHIYFPDPWPKNRHRRRRLFRMPNLHTLYQRLKPGGELRFSTDFFDYYLQAKLLVLLYPGLDYDDSPPPQEVYTSLFSRRFENQGKSIYFISAVKHN